MLRRHRLVQALVACALGGWISLLPALGEEPAPSGVVLEGVVLAVGAPTQARIEVRVRPAAGLPLSYRAPVAGEPLRALDGDEQGRFRIEGLSPGRYEVRATPPGGSPGLAFVTVPEGGGVLPLRVHVYAGAHVLRGRVRWTDGRPFRGWVSGSVWLADRLFQYYAEIGAFAQTDAEGRFALRGLPPQRIDLRVHVRERYEDRLRSVTLPHDDPLELVVGCSYDGAPWPRFGARVLDARTDEPVADALVVTDWWPFHRVRTDGSGRFTLQSDPAGDDLYVRAEGYAHRLLDHGEVAALGVVRLEPTAGIQGRVLGPTGPCAGVRVVASPVGDAWAEERDTRTDAAGRYRLDDVAPGTVHLFALGAGYASKRFAEVAESGWAAFEARTSAGETVERDIRVVDAGTLSVLVRDHDGSVRRPCRVTWAVRDRNGRGPPEALWGEAYLAADGRVRFEGVPPGLPLRVSATTAERLRATTECEAVARGGESVELRFEEPRFLTVRIRDRETKAPIPGARVRVYPAAWDGTPVGWSWVTGPDGAARIGPAPEGPYGVNVVAPGHLEHDPHERDIADDETTVELARGRRLRGRVEGPAELRGWPVRLELQPGPRAIGGVIHRFQAESHGVAVGEAFRLEDLSEGTFRAEARTHHDGHVWYAAASVEEGDDELVLRLRRSGSGALGEILVVDADGRPIRFGRVQATAGTGWCDVSSGWIQEGCVHLAALPEGAEVRISVLRAGTGGGWVGGALFGPFPRGHLPGRLVLGPARSIEGRVLAADGNPLADVSVNARPDRGEAEDWRAFDAHADVTTDAQGRFRLEGLGAGPHRMVLWAEAADLLPPPPRRLDLTEGDVDGVALRFVEELQVTITVLGPAGEPVRGASVRAEGAYDIFGSWSRPRTDEHGRVVLPGLSEGDTYELQVAPPPDRPEFAGVTIEDWTPQDQEVRLKPGAGVGGRVVDLEGRPLAGVGIRLSGVSADGGHHVHRITTDEEGRFSVRRDERLDRRPLTITLADDLSGFEPSPETPVEQVVRPGQYDVEIRIDRRRLLRVENLPGMGRIAERGPVTLGILLVREDGAHERRVGMRVISPRACFLLPEPGGLWTLYAGPVQGGKVALVSGLSAGSEPHALQVAETDAIRGTVQLPEDDERRIVKVLARHRGLELRGRPGKGGRFTIGLVPSDTSFSLAVTLDGPAGTEVVETDVVATAGDRVELRLP